MNVFLSILCLGFISTSEGQLSALNLQQCVSDVACTMNYSDIFQTKLDNVTHYTDLQVSLLKQQVDKVVQPFSTRLQLLENSTTSQLDTIISHLRSVENELVFDRHQLRNLTHDLYTLNDDYRKEAITRNQDVHQLTLDLSQTKHSLSQLQDAVNSLLTQNNMHTLQVLPVTTPAVPSCADKDQAIAVLQQNLTFYQKAYTTSENAADNLRKLQTVLQNQVDDLRQNVTDLITASVLKDQLIAQLQQRHQPSTAGAMTGCVIPLGMKNGTIPDSAITSSESQAGYGPANARLDNPQGWYTSEKRDTKDFLQIDLGGLFYLTKVATQGAPCCDVMVTNFTLQYSKDGIHWREYQDDCHKTYFTGNTDSSTVVTHRLDSAVMAQYVRFNIHDFRRDGVSNYVGMRAELYGCSAQ